MGFAFKWLVTVFGLTVKMQVIERDYWISSTTGTSLIVGLIWNSFQRNIPEM